MKIPKFKFDKNMLFDLKYELNRRTKEKRIIQEYEYSNIRIYVDDKCLVTSQTSTESQNNTDLLVKDNLQL